MERKIKVTEKIVDFFFKKKYAHVIGSIIGAMVGIVFGTGDYSTADTTPPTYYDYKELYDQKEANDVKLKNNKKLLLDDNQKNTFSSLEFTFENDKCKIVVSYDENLEPISVKEKDKNESWVIALGETIFDGIILMAITWFLIWCIIWLIVKLIIGTFIPLIFYIFKKVLEYLKSNS